MADKKYSEFSPGSPAASDLIALSPANGSSATFTIAWSVVTGAIATAANAAQTAAEATAAAALLACKLDDLAAPDDNTDLNASTSKHGLLKKLDNTATHFLDGTGAWSTPTGIVPAAHATSHKSGGSDSIKLDELAAPTDVTTLDVTSSQHGLAPKAPADATKFLNGAATPAFAAVKDSDLSTSDIATNNVSTSKHGFAPKAPNDATKYLDGTGAYTVPAGSTTAATVNLSGTYASLPAAGTAGRTYFCTDSPYFLRDNGSSWDHFLQGIKVTPPVSGNFGWINQGSATIATTSGGVYLLTPAAAANDLKIRKLTAPATPYTIEAGFLFNGVGTDFTQAGVTFRQSSDGKLANINLQAASGLFRIQSSKYTNATTFSAHYVTGPMWAGGALLFVQISDDGANRIVRISADNQNWIQLHSVTRTDFLTADEVGFFIQAGNTTYAQAMHLLHWRQF